MANFNVSVNTNYSALAGIVANDTITMLSGATLTVNQTTVGLGAVSIAGLHQILISNTSTTTPIFWRQQSSVLTVSGGGVFRTRGDYITIGTSNGTASQTFTLPTDAGGNRYQSLGGCVANLGGVKTLYAQASTFTEVFADDKFGTVFTHNVGAGTITFGDGVNGFIPPNGALIQVPNIQIQNTTGAPSVSFAGGVVDWLCTATANYTITPGFNTKSARITDFYFTDPSTGIQWNAPLQFTDFINTVISGSTNMIVTAQGTNSVLNNLFIFSERSTQHIPFNVTGTTPVVTDLRVLAKTATGTQFQGIVTLASSGGTYTNIYAAGVNTPLVLSGQGFTVTNAYLNASGTKSGAVRGAGLTLQTGSNYTLDGINSYPPSNFTSPSSVVLNYNGGVNTITKNGTFTGLNTTTFVNALAGTSILQTMTFSGTLTNLCTATGSFAGAQMADIFCSSATGLALNGMAQDSVMDGVSSSSLFGPAIRRGTQTIVAYSAGNTRTAGIVYNAFDPDVSAPYFTIVSGAAADFVLEGGTTYITANGASGEFESRVIRGLTAVGTAAINGTNTGDFTVEFALRLPLGTYGAYQTFDTTNLASAFAALTGYDSTVGFQMKTKITRTTGTGIGSSITNTTFLGTIPSGYRYPIAFNAVVNLTGLPSGARVQLYDVTNGLELANAVTGTSYQYTASLTANISLRVRVAYATAVYAMQFVEFTETLTSAGLSRTIDNIPDAVYASNGVDGSTITTVVIDDTNLLVNVDTGTIAWKDIYAYETYWLTTQVGIRDEGRFIEAVDTANYKIFDFKIKNVSSPSLPLIITDGYGVDGATGQALPILDTTGGTIYCAPEHVVAYFASGGIPTASDNAAAVIAAAVDGSTTLAESLRLCNAVLGGKVSGANTGTETFRDLADTKNRVVATVDVDGNRTAITRDLT